MNLIAGQLSREFRIDEGWSVLIDTLQDRLVAGSRRVLLLLLSAVGLVLLIACANVAGLVMTRRCVGRRGELSLRASLGANRSRLIQQLLIENLVLSLMGGSAGLVIGNVGRARRWCSAPLMPSPSDRWADVGLDGRVLAFTLGLSALTGIVFRACPRSAAIPIRSLWCPEGKCAGDRGSRHKRFRSVLVAGENRSRSRTAGQRGVDGAYSLPNADGTARLRTQSRADNESLRAGRAGRSIQHY